MDDEVFYEIAADEIEAGELRRGLWLKCLAESDGNDQKARAAYIRIRVEELRGEEAERQRKARSARRWQAWENADPGLLIALIVMLVLLLIILLQM